MTLFTMYLQYFDSIMSIIAAPILGTLLLLLFLLPRKKDNDAS